MGRRLSRCSILKMDALSKWQHDMEAKGKDAQVGDWAVFGILAMKSDIRSSSRGEKYVIWTLCDLRGHLLSCFLFGQAFHQHHRVEIGSVVCVANAKIMSNNSPSSSSSSSSSHSSTSSHSFLTVSLSVSLPTQLLVIGTSFDFALCASYKREQLATGGPNSSSLLHCKNMVDLRKGKYCDFHVREEYKRIAGARPGINKAFAGELSGLVRFGDKRMAVSKAGATSGHTRMQLEAVGGARLGSSWAPPAASSGSLFMMPPLKHAGKTVPIASTAKSAPTLKPSTDSARMLAMIRAENKSPHVTAAPEASSLVSASRAASVRPPSTKAQACSPPLTPLTRGSPSTPASVAQLRADRASAILSASAPNSRPKAAPTASLTTATNSALPLTENPFAAVLKPKPLSREEAARELRRLHALKALAQHGPVAAPNPNNSRTDNKDVLRTTAANKRKSDHNSIQASLTADGGVSVRHFPPASSATEAAPLPAPSSPTRAAKRAKLEALFGVMDESSARFQQLVSASSAHVAILADMKQDEREQYWQWLEAKEEMQRQMEAIREQPVEVWACADCNGRRTLHFPVLCKANGHSIDKRPAIKRFFECGQCRSRVTTIDSPLPLHCCHKCGAAQWKAGGMVSERAGMAASVRSELQHKSAETWLRSDSAMEGGMRNDHPNNTQGALHDDDR